MEPSAWGCASWCNDHAECKAFLWGFPKTCILMTESPAKFAKEGCRYHVGIVERNKYGYPKQETDTCMEEKYLNWPEMCKVSAPLKSHYVFDNQFTSFLNIADCPL